MSLSNEEYNEIMSVYDERAAKRRRELLRRRERLAAKIPRIPAIEDEIRQAAIAEVRRRLVAGRDAGNTGIDGKVGDGKAGGYSGSSDTGKSLIAIEELQKEKSRLMQQAGFASDYLEVPYVCPDCQDTGYIDGRHCHCYKQLAMEMFSDSHTDVMVGMGLSDFSLEYYPGDIVDEETECSSAELAEKTFASAKVFVSRFDTSFENILLFGKTGTGKTHLSSCIGGELLSSGHTVCYLTAFEMFAILKREMFSRDVHEDEDYHRMFTCDLLIIDDLGTEFANTMTNSQLFQLINERIRRKKSTLISTNLEPNELRENYTERLVSRFVEYYKILKLAGPDIRGLKKRVAG